MTEPRRENPYKNLEFDQKISKVEVETKNGPVEISLSCPRMGQLSDAKRVSRTEEEIEIHLIHVCTNIPVNIIRDMPPIEYGKLQKALSDFLPDSFKQNPLASMLQQLS